ncbi:phosphate ABC transporter periplasmic substrate- binding protein [Haladaptatus paucihalophilus DX253]|uniref:Phosphate ABC transporter periplasmic substrate-binding protein n=1 Tax=Haladaptatus paucihalophilus DX253 TaxID=797209 RepID=E7R067_HALPU|nr:substrate-binding domain-containing protein [Haladaptatus paucihalophilus]EFW89961.1 phosphate ABC transporter periplasmic substrate- binding protein [Haladaptatus paucihalophilus DX253]SHK59440.1 phosphate ABC transporter substrate-binding protein, PhoT family [Haladaptatus paucihalophilus DX253]
MSGKSSSGVSRRKFLVAAGTSSALALAGCTDNGSSGETTDGDGGNNDDTGNNGGNDSSGALTAGGSSTVYPITNKAASVWGYNPPADDKEYWPQEKYGISTDKNLADYWASKYGFEAGKDGQPPFNVSIGLSHSGVGLTKLQKGQVDIGDASAPVDAELDASKSELEKFKNHVVGVDAQPIVVSKYLYENGVKKLKADTVRKIYTGKIKKWSEVDGYTGKDMEVQAIGRSVGSGTDTSFRANMLGSGDAKMPGVDIRKGENQEVAKAVGNANNAIAYMALAFVSKDVPAIALNFDGTTYEPGKNLSDKGYPLSRDLHCYTYEGTSKKEAAFLRMILTEFGQGQFVDPAGYATLSDSRRKEELSKLPETTN